MADKYKWYATKDGQTFNGSASELMDITGLSEYQIYKAVRDNKRFKGWFVYRETINYDDAIYDVVDDDDEIIFSGTEKQIERHFKFKMLKIYGYLDGKMKLKKKYRVFRQNEFEKPKYSQETMDIALMLKMYGNTGANGHTLKRTIHELRQMGIRVNIERSSHWKDYYILTRRDNAEARSQSI